MNRYWSFQPLRPEEWSEPVEGDVRILSSWPFAFPDYALVNGEGPLAVLFETGAPPRSVEPFWIDREVSRVVASFDATSIAIQWACQVAAKRVRGALKGDAALLLELARLRASGLAEPGTLQAHVEQHLPALERAHLRRELTGFEAVRLLIEPGPVPFARAIDSLRISRSGEPKDNDGSMRPSLLELLEAKLAQVATNAGGEV